MPGENGAGAIELFQQHDAHELMRPSGGSEREPELGACGQARRESVGTADDKAHGRTVFRAPFAQQRRQHRAIEALTALVENDDNRAVGNDIGERDRFLDAATLGILGATFAYLDDFDVAQAERTAGRFRALAIQGGELAFGSLLQAADCGDDKAHGPPHMTAQAKCNVALRGPVGRHLGVAKRYDASSAHASCRTPSRPHPFEIVEGADFGAEDVNDHVAGVDQHPVAMRNAFDAGDDAGFVQVLDDPVGDRADMALRPAGSHDHVVADRRFVPEVDGEGVLRLHIVEAVEDQTEDLLGVRTHSGDRFGHATVGPKDRRCGQGSLSFRSIFDPGQRLQGRH